MVLSYYHAGGPWQHTLAPGRHGRLRGLRSAAGTATADKRDAGAPITGDPGSRGIPLRCARDHAPARCRFRSPIRTPPGGDTPLSLHRPLRGTPRIAGSPDTRASAIRCLPVHSACRGGIGGAAEGRAGGRPEDLRVPRKASDGASDPPPGVRKPMTPQTARVETSTITAIRIPIMYRMEAPNALRYLRRPTTLR